MPPQVSALFAASLTAALPTLRKGQATASAIEFKMIKVRNSESPRVQPHVSGRLPICKHNTHLCGDLDLEQFPALRRVPDTDLVEAARGEDVAVAGGEAHVRDLLMVARLHLH